MLVAFGGHAALQYLPDPPPSPHGHFSTIGVEVTIVVVQLGASRQPRGGACPATIQ